MQSVGWAMLAPPLAGVSVGDWRSRCLSCAKSRRAEQPKPLDAELSPDYVFQPVHLSLLHCITGLAACRIKKSNGGSIRVC